MSLPVALTRLTIIALSADSVRAPAAYPRLARVLPALAFFGGFILDALTLGRQIIPIDFVVLTGYCLICAIPSLVRLMLHSSTDPSSMR